MFGGANMSNYGGSANGMLMTPQEQDKLFKNELKNLLIKIREHMQPEPAKYQQFKDICKHALQ